MSKHAIAYTYRGEERLIGPLLGQVDRYKLSTLENVPGVSDVRVIEMECWYETKTQFEIPNVKGTSRKQTYEKRRRIHGGSTMVDATGSIRRLQALVSIGWSLLRLEREYGVAKYCFKDVIARNSKIGVEMHRLIVRIYEEKWDQAPPVTTTNEKQAASRAKTWARKHGWYPPLAWDDDDIDDPAAKPDGSCSDPDCLAYAKKAGQCISHYWRAKREAA